MTNSILRLVADWASNPCAKDNQAYRAAKLNLAVSIMRVLRFR